MKSSFAVSLFSGLILLGGLSFWTLSDVSNPQRQFEFKYQVSIKGIPKEARALNVWAPLAKTDTCQRILDRKIQLSYPYKIYKDPDYGNEILNLQLGQSLPEEINFQVNYRVSSKGEPHLIMSQGEASAVQKKGLVESSLEPYLKSDKLMVVNQNIKKMAEKITVDKKTDLEKARAIYDYVIAHMKYDKNIEGWGKGDTLRACVVGAGNCTDFHSLFISLARASGIPARFKIGAQIPTANPEGPIGYHCWAEFYLEGRWIPVDASEAWKNPDKREYYFGSVDENKFTLSLGRDIALSNGREVNILIYPYVEVDGKPFQSVETSFYFRDIGKETVS